MEHFDQLEAAGDKEVWNVTPFQLIGWNIVNQSKTFMENNAEQTSIGQRRTVPSANNHGVCNIYPIIGQLLMVFFGQLLVFFVPHHWSAFNDILYRSLTISPAEVGNAGGEVIFQEECGGSGHVDCAIWIVDTKVCWRTMLDTVVGPILSPIRPSRPPSTCHPHLPQDTRQDQHCTSSSVFHLRPRIWSVWEFTSKIIVGDADAATAPGICVEWLRLSRWQYNTPSASTAGLHIKKARRWKGAKHTLLLRDWYAGLSRN